MVAWKTATLSQRDGPLLKPAWNKKHGWKEDYANRNLSLSLSLFFVARQTIRREETEKPDELKFPLIQTLADIQFLSFSRFIDMQKILIYGDTKDYFSIYLNDIEKEQFKHVT